MYTGRLKLDLGRIPAQIALTVGECRPNAGYLLRRLNHTYRHNRRFGRLFYNDCQRSTSPLYSCLTHWLYGWLARNGVMTGDQAIEYQRQAGCFGGSQIEIGR